MNCPTCNAPLFSATVCGCGYRHEVRLSIIDLSYWEALAAYWRIYWPTQVFGIVGYLPLVLWTRVSGSAYTLQLEGLSGVAQLLIQFGLAAIGLFLFVHRFLSSSFRTFSIHLVRDPQNQENSKLALRDRVQVWFFLWWRQIVAGFIAGILSAPLNVLVGLIGLRTVLGINIAFWISTLGVILAVGPILLKMLIGHQFKDFRFEVKRFAPNSARVAPASARNPPHGEPPRLG